MGLVGGGLVAQAVHLPTLSRLDGLFSIRAIADPSQRIVDILAERHGIQHRYSDWRALVEDPDVDAVAVCSPHGTHAAVALACLQAGRHVLVEKPMTITVADADRICELCRETGLVVQVGYMKRFDVAYELMLEALPDTAEELRFIDVVTCDPGLAREPFVPQPIVPSDGIPPGVSAEAQADLRDQVEAAVGVASESDVRAFGTTYLAALIHDVNLVHGVLEHLGLTPLASALTSRYWCGGDAVSATVDLDAGARWQSAWLSLTGVSEWSERATFHFDDQIHRLELPPPYQRDIPSRYERVQVRSQGSGSVSVSVRGESFEREWRHFHDCVVGGAPCRTPPEQARADIALLRELYLARQPVPS